MTNEPTVIWLTVDDFNALDDALTPHIIHDIWIPLANEGFNNVKIGNVVYAVNYDE